MFFAFFIKKKGAGCMYMVTFRNYPSKIVEWLIPSTRFKEGHAMREHGAWLHERIEEPRVGKERN